MRGGVIRANKHAPRALYSSGASACHVRVKTRFVEREPYFARRRPMASDHLARACRGTTPWTLSPILPLLPHQFQCTFFCVWCRPQLRRCMQQ